MCCRRMLTRSFLLFYLQDIIKNHFGNSYNGKENFVPDAGKYRWWDGGCALQAKGC